MVHKSDYRTSQVSNMNFYRWKSLTDRMYLYQFHLRSTNGVFELSRVKMHVIKIAFSHSLRRSILMKFDSNM